MDKLLEFSGYSEYPVAPVVSQSMTIALRREEVDLHSPHRPVFEAFHTLSTLNLIMRKTNYNSLEQYITL